MWLTVPQLAGLLNVTERAIQKAIADGRYKTFGLNSFRAIRM